MSNIQTLKMKKIFTCLLAVVFALPLFAQHASVSYRLEKAMVEKPQQLHHVGIMLSDRVDVYAMAKEFDQRKASIQERSEKVVAALKAKAAATQGEVIDFLKKQPGIELQSVNGYWINNIVFAKVSSEVVKKLQINPAVEKIDLNGKLMMTEVAEESCEFMPPIPNGAEPGLKAINAHKLWELGYTGRTRLALGADTGIDPSHPALKNQYRGAYFDESLTWFDSPGENNNGSTSPFDCGDHGTHTIGTILGIDRLTNDTIGVAPNATWIGAKIICGNDTGTEDNIGSFQWAINPDGDSSTVTDIPDVINNSWWDPQEDDECNSVYVDVLQAMEAVGIAVIFSAGNSGPAAGTVTSPHNINYDLVNLFAVGALNGSRSDFPIAGFSSRGPSECVQTDSALNLMSLNIKPEVSAPGVDVRSSVPGGYGNKSGTSMAAPHVCGAILLLREAFPYLTGRDLKFALYNSAVDLGALGEDNTYGTGIIDVKAAYDSLVAQGNIPVDPGMANDVLLIEVKGPDAYCGNSVFPELLVENLGTETLTSLDILVEIPSASMQEVINWTGSIAPGERTTIVMDAFTVPTGTWDISIELQNPNGTIDEHLLNNRFLSTIVVNSRDFLDAYVADDPTSIVCEGTRALLRNEFQLTTPGEITYEWYDQPAGGRLLGTGQTYLTDPLFESATFYADILAEYETGALDNSIGIVAQSFFTLGGIKFDASFPFTLKSVKVYPIRSGFINIALLGEDGEAITSTDVFVNAQNTVIEVPLNFEVPQGRGLALELQKGDSDNIEYVSLNFNRTGGEFPYVIDDVVSLTSSTAGPANSGQYWYFYDWKIEHREVCGRAPVQVDINADSGAPSASFDQSAPTVDINNSPIVDFTDNSVDAVEWLWNFGDGTTSTEQNPTHTYDRLGEFTVSLTITNAGGCTASATSTVFVTDGSSSVNNFGEIEGVKVFPNPTAGLVNIEMDFEQNENVTVQLTDLLGKPLRNVSKENLTQGTFNMDISELSSGVYLLVFKTETKRAVKKILKL